MIFLSEGSSNSTVAALVVAFQPGRPDRFLLLVGARFLVVEAVAQPVLGLRTLQTRGDRHVGRLGIAHFEPITLLDGPRVAGLAQLISHRAARPGHAGVAVVPFEAEGVERAMRREIGGRRRAGDRPGRHSQAQDDRHRPGGPRHAAIHSRKTPSPAAPTVPPRRGAYVGRARDANPDANRERRSRVRLQHGAAERGKIGKTGRTTQPGGATGAFRRPGR